MKEDYITVVSGLLRPGITLVIAWSCQAVLWTEVALGQRFPNSYPRQVDLAVNGIFLNDRQTALSSGGVSRPWTATEDHLSYLICLNRDKSEVLTLYHHQNVSAPSYQEFKVSRADERWSTVACHLDQVEHFVSFRKIQLGMPLNEVTDIFGDDFRVKSPDGELLVEYALESNLYSKFLKFYKETRYYGRYRFKGGRLIEYRFGFAGPL